MVCLVLAALAAVGVVWAVRPPKALEQGPRTVEVPAALGILGIGRLLAEQGVIRSQTVFVGLAVVRGTARSLKAGEYEVPQGAPLPAVLNLLETGRVKPHLLVLPEGFTIRELARQVEAEGVAPAAEVIRTAGSARMAGASASSPTRWRGTSSRTFRFTKGMRVEEILARMVQRFRDRSGRPTSSRAPSGGPEPPATGHPGLDRGEGSGAGGGTAHHRPGLPEPPTARHAPSGRSHRRLRTRQGRAGADPRRPPRRPSVQHLQEPRSPAGPHRQSGPGLHRRRPRAGQRPVPVLRGRRRPGALLLHDPRGAHAGRGAVPPVPGPGAHVHNSAPANGPML